MKKPVLLFREFVHSVTISDYQNLSSADLSSRNLIPKAYCLSGSGEGGEFAAFLPTRKAICPGNEVGHRGKNLLLVEIQLKRLIIRSPECYIIIMHLASILIQKKIIILLITGEYFFHISFFL